MRFFGFDSFEGLPAGQVDRSPWWKKGNYASSFDFVKRHTPDPRITLVKGFYSRAVFRDFETKHGAPNIGVMLIDSDIYESAKAVLDYFGPHLKAGAVVLFDDLRNTGQRGEARAIEESKLLLEHLFDYGNYGSAFRVGSERK